MNRRMFSCIAAHEYASRTCCGAVRYWTGHIPRIGCAPSGGTALGVETGLVCAAGEHADGHVYNVGCGDRISVNELWHRIGTAAGFTDKAKYAPARAGDVRDSLASLDRIRQALGYQPMVDLDEGLKRTLNFFRDIQ